MQFNKTTKLNNKKIFNLVERFYGDSRIKTNGKVRRSDEVWFSTKNKILFILNENLNPLCTILPHCSSNGCKSNESRRKIDFKRAMTLAIFLDTFLL